MTPYNCGILILKDVVSADDSTTIQCKVKDSESPERSPGSKLESCDTPPEDINTKEKAQDPPKSEASPPVEKDKVRMQTKYHMFLDQSSVHSPHAEKHCFVVGEWNLARGGGGFLSQLTLQRFINVACSFPETAG